MEVTVTSLFHLSEHLCMCSILVFIMLQQCNERSFQHGQSNNIDVQLFFVVRVR